MKIKFSKFERTAGFFILSALVAFVVFVVIVAFKQGWFTARHYFMTSFDHGDGLHSGTLVQMAGLRAGTVDSVVLTDDNKIQVKLSIMANFRKRVKTDSIARVIRPFVIGDKVVEVTVGSKDMPLIPEEGIISSEETMDVMDLLGGGKLGPYLKTLDSLLTNLRVVAEAFTDPKRTQAFIGIFDEMLPTMVEIQEATRQMTKDKNLRHVMKNMTQLTVEVNQMLPQMVEFSKRLPEMGELSYKTLKEMTTLTEQMNKFLPVFVEIAPQLPAATQKSIRALEEAVIVLRAMQKSFLLRGSVKDIQEEDLAKQEAEEKEKSRKPASESE